MPKDVIDFQKQFESFQNYTISARALSERDQDYDDHHQWTDAEVEELERRNQAPVVINRAKTKINLLTGIQTKSRTQPKALPRTPQHTDGADAVTEALRYIVDNTDFQCKSSACFRDQMVPGYGGGITEFDGDNVVFNQIPWDRYYYDQHARELDFSDKKFDGIVIWMDREDVKEDFPDKAKDIDVLLNQTGGIDGAGGSDTFDDKPRLWVDQGRNRIRVCQHFYKEEGVWWMCFFTENLFLLEPAESPYLDEHGKPDNPIEMQTAYIDRELQRYGEMRSYIWLQDEINHRRSRLLYAGSVNRTMGEDGAVDDINTMKQELAKADGHIKTNKGFEFQVLPNDAISETQLLLYRESKAEIDEIGANAALAGKSNARSGRQEQIQQQGGVAELASLYSGHKDFENRVYRQMWNRVKQSWKAEKWIRVTDDADNLEWVGLNQPVTNGDLLMQAAQEGNPDAVQLLQNMVDDPRLNEVADTKNNVVEMDVDIVITEAPDLPTLRQETVEGLLKLAERYGPESVPFAVALELSDLPNKDTVKKMLEPDIPPEVQQEQQQLQELIRDLEIADKKATVEDKTASAQKKAQEAEAQAIENEIVKSGIGNIFADRDADSEAKQIDNTQKRIETIKLAEEPTESVNVNV